VDLERGPLSLVSTIEELIDRKSSSSGLESREYGRRDLSRWPRGTLYLQKLALTLPTNGSRSVGIVRWRTQTTEFFLLPSESITLYGNRSKYGDLTESFDTANILKFSLYQ
jgi:hypothetical protein